MAAWRRAIELSLTDADTVKLKSIAQPVVDTNDSLTDVIHFNGLQPTYAPRSRLPVILFDTCR
jgi:hypothetical protein